MSTVKNKQRLLRLLKYLFENTDEEHQVSTNELMELFKEDAGAGRKTIKDDIDTLISEGFDIVTTKSYYNSFYYRKRPLDPTEIKMLIDAVSASQFITKEKSEQLIRKLSRFVSKYQAEKLVRHLYAANRIKQGNQQIYEVVDSITDAINESAKISFQYFEYTSRKEKVLRNQGEIYILSPYALVWDDNHYYVVGYSDKRSKVINFRVDRMYRPRIMADIAVKPPTSFNIDDYVQKQFKMFVGEDMEVTLEVDNDLMKSIIDHFGEDIDVWQAQPSTFRTKVLVNVSPTFYGWVFQFGGRVRIIGPVAARDGFRKILAGFLCTLKDS